MKALRKLSLEQIIVRLFISWFLSSTFMYFFSTENFGQLSYLQSIQPFYMIAIFVFVFCLWNALFFKFKTTLWDAYGILVSSIFYAGVTLINHYEFYYMVGVIGLFFIVVFYLMKEDQLHLSHLTISKTTTKLFFVIFFCTMFGFIGFLTTIRYLAYNASTYDFGIFSQMFYYLRKSFIPFTTCERDMLMSHFNIHISPIFYLLLPVYALFPNPVTLQVAQAFVVASGLIPLYLLAKHYHFPNYLLIILFFMYAFNPTLIASNFYDIHENMFLTPLILWMFYFFEKKKIVLTLLFSILVLLVKEDAAVYIAFIGLYFAVGRKSYKQGFGLLILACAYFIGAVYLLNANGEGAMTWRYNNFISDPKYGLFSIAGTIFLDPAYLFYQIFNLEKIQFIILTLVPIGFLPFLSKKYAYWILMGPYLIMNLMPDYPYQHSIEFQYNYGVGAIFFYLVVIHMNSLTTSIKKYLLPMVLISTLLVTLMTNAYKVGYYVNYLKDYETIQQINTSLQIIPDGVSVEANGYFVSKLSSRDELYDVSGSSHKYLTDYVALDMRPGREKNDDKTIQKYIAHGYIIVVNITDVIIILEK